MADMTTQEANAAPISDGKNGILHLAPYTCIKISTPKMLPSKNALNTTLCTLSLQRLARTVQHVRCHLDCLGRRAPVLLLDRGADEGVHGCFEPVGRVGCEDDVFELLATGELFTC
jgi:hypothetical protein